MVLYLEKTSAFTLNKKFDF